MTEPPAASHAEALALARAGRFEDAAAMLQRIVAAHPGDVSSWTLMAAVRQRLGQPAAALACYDAIVRLTPDDAEAHLARGNIQAGLSDVPEALESFDHAARLAPTSAFAHSNRASMLLRQNRLDEALAAADRALGLDERLVHAWRHRGFALFCLGDVEAAVAAYRRGADAADPAQAYEALTDLAMALAASGRYDEAIAALDRAVASRPQAAEAILRRSESRLLIGDFVRGWEDYEARLRHPVFLRANGELSLEVRDRLILSPRPEDLAGQRVLVVGEQGLGDQVMFASVLPDLAAVAAAVTCIADPRLVRLFRRSFPGIAFAGAGEGRQVDLAAVDRVVALGSLPLMFRRDEGQFPGQPYLSPSPDLTAGWRRRLDAAGDGLKIGLSWRGGVSQTRSAARSMDLAGLRPLLDRDGCTFVSLQYGDVDAEIAAVNATLRRPILSFPAAETFDMEDLAGLVGTMDVVVTVQTTLAHVTGAMGVPGLVMIPRWPEWRYGRQGERMVWYGSLRLLRQSDSDDWGPVVAEIGRRLDERRAPGGLR